MAYFQIKKFVEQNEEILRRSNVDEMCFHCPFCPDDDPRGTFYVNRQTLKYFCHRCNKGGGPDEVQGEYRRLAPPALPKISLPPSYVSLMPRPKPAFHNILRERPLIRKLLREKNFRWEDLQGYHIGYCTEGEFSSRLIFPVHFRGIIIGYQARRLTEHGPKYRNIHGQGAFAQVLYNWGVARQYDTIVIVEGIFDVIRVGLNAVATMGTYLSPWRVDLINALHPKKVIIMLDGDAFVKAYKVSRKIFKTIKVLGVKLPPDKDPAKLSRGIIQGLLTNAKEFNLGQLSDITLKK